MAEERMTAEKPEEAIARALFERDVKYAGSDDTWAAAKDGIGLYWDDASTALAALKAAGWAVVPRKPTEAIMAAYLTAQSTPDADNLAANPLA